MNLFKPFLLVLLLLFSILHLAPKPAPCPDCGVGIELGFQESYTHFVEVNAGVSYRLKLSIKEGGLLFYESKLRTQGVLGCSNTSDTIVCEFKPYKDGKAEVSVISESKKSNHILWFETQ